MNKSNLMTRAWELCRDEWYGFDTFGDALAAAWAEAKGELTILNPDDFAEEVIFVCELADDEPTVDGGQLIREWAQAEARADLVRLAA